MAATKMFSRFKGSASMERNVNQSPQTTNSSDVNPIFHYFELGKLCGSAGPELSWQIYDAVRKEDKKVKLCNTDHTWTIVSINLEYFYIDQLSIDLDFVFCFFLKHLTRIKFSHQWSVFE